MVLSRQQQKAMFAQKAIKELAKFGQHSPLFEQEVNKLGMDNAHKLVGSFGSKSDRVVEQNLRNFASDKINQSIVDEKEKIFKGLKDEGLSRDEIAGFEDNIESDIRHELREEGLDV